MKNFLNEIVDAKLKKFILDILIDLNGSVASIEDLSDVALPYDEVTKKLNLFYKNEHLGYIETSFEGNVCNMNFFPKTKIQSLNVNI